MWIYTDQLIRKLLIQAVCLILISISLGGTRAAKFLIPEPPVFGMGHIQSLSAVSAALVQRGHHVTLLCGTKDCTQKFSKCNASEIVTIRSNSSWDSVTGYDKLAAGESSYGSFLDQVYFVKDSYNFMASICNDLFNDIDTISYLQNVSFNMIIADCFNPCDFLLPEHLNLPFIALTGNRVYPHLTLQSYKTPIQYAYMPKGQMTDEMNFFQRVKNVFRVGHILFFYIVRVDEAFYTIKNKFAIGPNITSLIAMAQKAQVWLSQEDSSLDFPHPGMPNWIPVGGIAVRSTEPLPMELEEFIAGSGDHGVVLFSPGSIINALPSDALYTSVIASVLSRLPQRVIWKHKGTPPKNLGNNTMIMPWIPQNDLLGHPKTKLYISHGGLNGIYEAIHHAVPMIVIPMMLDDQRANAARVVAKGIGIHIEKEDLTEDIFQNCIKKVLYGKSYKEAINRASGILRDNRPMERAIFWIEHVLKFGGNHLRAQAFELNFIQRHLIDVWTFLLVVTVGTLLVVKYICAICWRRLKAVGKKQVKQD